MELMVKNGSHIKYYEKPSGAEITVTLIVDRATYRAVNDCFSLLTVETATSTKIAASNTAEFLFKNPFEG